MIQTKMEILKIAIVNFFTISIAYSLSDAKDILALISISIGIGYGIWKWRNDIKKNKKE